MSVISRIDGRGGKMYSFCAMYSLRMSFCSVPEIFFQSAPCFSATARYIARRMDAARERKFAGEREVALKVEIRDVVRCRERIDFHAADGREVLLPRTAFRDRRIVNFATPSRPLLPDLSQRLG